MSTFTLKTYQSKTLNALSRFLQESTTKGLEVAWAHAMARQHMPSVPYRADELGGVPCVCLRVPTGGGKTLLAASAIARIARDWAGQPFPLALWLTPSDIIRTQTLDALRKPGHPYGQALRDTYGDRLHIVALDELHTVPPQAFGSAAIVVVATIQTFRVERKADRKVYSFSEAFEPHFRALGLSAEQAKQRGLSVVEQADLDAEKQSFLTEKDLGRVKISAANLLALMRPIVIVDEAHNAKTPKSLDTLRTIQPCAVLDLTATPVPKKTNVLYSVSARELEAEEMIKLPILLAEHAPDLWADAVRDAVLRRHALEKEAANEPDYVRPIVLFQAQDKGGEITVERLKTHLIESEKIPDYEIAIATGTQRELEGLNLFDPACQIRYVITVDALREGWDCSFAYVLCALQNVRSNAAVEQLLGRVLRMPYAKRRKSPALNRAYAQVIAKTFTDAASALADKLVEGMGFNPIDARGVLLPDPGDLFGGLPTPNEPAARAYAPLEVSLPASARDEIAQHPDIEVVAEEGETIQVRVRREITPAMEATLIKLANPEERVAEKIETKKAQDAALRAPSERGETFASFPLLAVHFQGELQLLDEALLEELIDFDLTLADPQPKLLNFQMVQESEQLQIYLEGEHVAYGRANEQQLSLNYVPTQLTQAELVRTLALQLRMKEMPAKQLELYIDRIIVQLLHSGSTLTGLQRALFPLGQAILRRIESVRKDSRSQSFQQLLFAQGETKLGASAAFAFQFAEHKYCARQVYVGAWRFDKHFSSRIADLKTNGEEFECAKAIDLHPRVKYWLRNLVGEPQRDFWLQTSTDKFYPDFLVELVDGTRVALEYKGEAYATNDDSREKKLLGERWAAASGCRFAMVEKTLNGANVSQQLGAAFEISSPPSLSR